MQDKLTRFLKSGSTHIGKEGLKAIEKVEKNMGQNLPAYL